MNCRACHGLGIVPFVDVSIGKPDADVTADDLLFAICLCAPGKAYRNDRNSGHRVAPIWHVWCARNKVNTNRVFMLEQVYDAKQLQVVGLSPGIPTAVDRRAALLAVGRGKSR
jgi:hypothetical protein